MRDGADGGSGSGGRVSPQRAAPRGERGPGAQFADFCAFFACALGVLGVLAGGVLAVAGLSLGAPLRVALVPAVFAVGTAVLLFGAAVFMRRLARRFEGPPGRDG